MLRQFRGTPFERDLRRAIDKLGELLPAGVTVRLDTIADFLSVLPSTQVEYDPDSFCTSLARSSAACACTWSTGQPAGTRQPVATSILTSYRWFPMAGTCSAIAIARRVRQFAATRLASVKETGETFDRPADFCVESFMKDGFHALRGDGDHDVVLRFGPMVAGLIKEKTWHHSQKLEPQPDGCLIVRLHVSDCGTIKRWAMSWGSDCEVLGPPELREMIGGEVREMLSAMNGARGHRNRRERAKSAPEKTAIAERPAPGA